MKITVEAYFRGTFGDELMLRFHTSENETQRVHLFLDAESYEQHAQKIQKELNISCNVQQLASVIADLHTRCENLREDVAGFSVEATAYWKISDVAGVYIVIRSAAGRVVYETALVPSHELFCRHIATIAADRVQIARAHFMNAFARIRERCEQLSATCEV